VGENLPDDGGSSMVATGGTAATPLQAAAGWRQGAMGPRFHCLRGKVERCPVALRVLSAFICRYENTTGVAWPLECPAFAGPGVRIVTS
jgi:hypothetical protein